MEVSTLNSVNDGAELRLSSVNNVTPLSFDLAVSMTPPSLDLGGLNDTPKFDVNDTIEITICSTCQLFGDMKSEYPREFAAF